MRVCRVPEWLPGGSTGVSQSGLILIPTRHRQSPRLEQQHRFRHLGGCPDVAGDVQPVHSQSKATFGLAKWPWGRLKGRGILRETHSKPKIMVAAIVPSMNSETSVVLLTMTISDTPDAEILIVGSFSR